jgi:hypothetical protein
VQAIVQDAHSRYHITEMRGMPKNPNVALVTASLLEGRARSVLHDENSCGQGKAIFEDGVEYKATALYAAQLAWEMKTSDDFGPRN